jgi:hypothetical protein
MAMVIVGIYVDEATQFWASSSSDMTLVTCDVSGGKPVKKSIEEDVGTRLDRRLEPGVYGLKCEGDVTFLRPGKGVPLRIATKGGKDPWPVPLQKQAGGKFKGVEEPAWKDFHSQSGDWGTKFLFSASSPADDGFVVVERVSIVRRETAEEQIKAGGTP